MVSRNTTRSFFSATVVARTNIDLPDSNSQKKSLFSLRDIELIRQAAAAAVPKW
jgi:hypothetical protein